jgi:hypothetical protein
MSTRRTNTERLRELGDEFFTYAALKHPTMDECNTVHTGAFYHCFTER